MPGRIASSYERRRKSQPSINNYSKRTRFSRKRISFDRSTSNEDDTDSTLSDGSDEYLDTPQPKRTRLAPGRSVTTTNSTHKRRNTRASKAKFRVAMSTGTPSHSLGKRVEKNVRWQTLPYELLLQIFQYASYPLCNERFETNPSVQWLIQLALICRSFAEPALSALYYAPPLSPPSRAHKLFTHLQTQSSSSTINYKAKVKYLDLEAISTLAKKYNGLAPLDLGELVVLVPQLRGIRIHLMADKPQYKREISIIHRVRPIYRESLIKSLTSTGIRLQTFKWNFFFNRDQWPWCSLAEIHSTAPFQTLRSLELVELNTFTKNAKQLEQANELVKAIDLLPNLTGLSFTLCTLHHKQDILNRLPKRLESLEFSDCEDITSNVLARLLHTHGGNLRSLTLNHNRCLDLAFLADFAITCPKLELFRMDLTFFGLLVTALDSEPRFEALLPQGAIPTWPSTLQSIELNHLRKWQTEGARTFFQSLVDSAEKLPSLRCLVIKASVEMAWRDRIEFRNTWIERLTNVFKRRSSCPEQYPQPIPSSLDRNTTRRTREPRVSDSHTMLKTAAHNESSHTESDSDVPIITRRSRRLVNQSLEESSCADSTRSNTVRKQADSKEEKEDISYVHGLCDIVDVRIDNLRPMETQYQETDFMDDEPSGDEDWEGEDLELPGSNRHAW